MPFQQRSQVAGEGVGQDGGALVRERPQFAGVIVGEEEIAVVARSRQILEVPFEIAREVGLRKVAENAGLDVR